MSQEDSEARIVHRTEKNGDVPDNDGDVFDFFKHEGKWCKVQEIPKSNYRIEYVVVYKTKID